MSKQVIDLEPQDQQILVKILRRHLTPKTTVWVFGSRVKGSARKYSDVDLAIDMSSHHLPLEIIADLATDFEESDLPFNVDIVDLNSISQEFKKLIDQEKILLPY